MNVSKFVKLNPFYLFFALFILNFGLSACLKTRAQLRDESSSELSTPVPAHPVQEVESQQHGGYAIDEMKAEFTRLEGRLEDLERAQKEATSNKSGLETRVHQLEQGQLALQENLKKSHETPPPILDPSELYKKGLSQFSDEEYELALESFIAYLKIPRVKKADEATFLKGECFYNLKQYKKAIVEYSKFPEKFTHSVRMPEALYKIGRSFDALGMRDDAKGFYQELVEKFPKSSEAKKVRKKLK